MLGNEKYVNLPQINNLASKKASSEELYNIPVFLPDNSNQFLSEEGLQTMKLADYENTMEQHNITGTYENIEAQNANLQYNIDKIKEANQRWKKMNINLIGTLFEYSD
eukprot:TRINITY_DN901_c0_g1_i2.p1 TRINITY_DN901_c0_g1~~TRINITY_DN901_c0_g1_i2.p1  ORF type:complete len:108 (-),score=26.82 TRINITY_DN901_c0_g1_i2:125-448(-)